MLRLFGCPLVKDSLCCATLSIRRARERNNQENPEASPGKFLKRCPGRRGRGEGIAGGTGLSGERTAADVEAVGCQDSPDRGPSVDHAPAALQDWVSLKGPDVTGPGCCGRCTISSASSKELVGASDDGLVSIVR